MAKHSKFKNTTTKIIITLTTTWLQNWYTIYLFFCIIKINKTKHFLCMHFTFTVDSRVQIMFKLYCILLNLSKIWNIYVYVTNFVDSYKFGVNRIFHLPDFSFSLLDRFKYTFEFQAKSCWNSYRKCLKQYRKCSQFNWFFFRILNVLNGKIDKKKLSSFYIV